MKGRTGFMLSLTAIALMLFAGQASAKYDLPSIEEREVTWDDAPPIAHSLKFTLSEAQSLFYPMQQPHVGYNLDRSTLVTRTQGGRQQKTGRPFVNGQWKLEPRPSTAVDKEYRPHWNGAFNNPGNLYVRSAYQYLAPLGKEELKHWENVAKKNPSARPRVDLKIVAVANSYLTKPEEIAKEKEARHKRYADLTRQEHKHYDYTYEDLGFGIMHSDMLCYLKKNRKDCQVDIQLIDEKHFAKVWITLMNRQGAVSQNEAIDIARGAAIIMSNKIWGTNLRPPGLDKGIIGISDVWLTAEPGNTPEEDRHSNEVKLGEKINVVIAHQPPPGDKPVRINIWFRPGQDAVAASIERTRQRLQKLGPDANFTDPYKEPLDVTSIDGIPEAVTYDEEGRRRGIDVKFKTLPNGTTVAYVPLYSDDFRGFIKGPGSWEIEIEMEQVVEENLEGEDKVLQLSTAKTNITVLDNPAIARRMYYLPDDGK